MAEGAFKILLVEDQVRHQKIYAESINEALGARVDVASTGADAWRLLTAPEIPDLVVLDLEIPGIRGEELMGRIKADHRLNLVPVIVLTGLSSIEKQMELLDLGADDFIEKGGPPSVLIARIRAQMRHKLAIDRLERMALDRDLFAAGVLQDIGSSKGTILALCRSAQEALRHDPVATKAQVFTILDKLAGHASKLGAYANDVIQSVRETQRDPALAPQDIGQLLNWVTEVLGEPIAKGDAAPETIPVRWEALAPLKPVYADKSFLRLALLNIVQRTACVAGKNPPLLHVSQSEQVNPQDPQGRRFLTTHLRDHGEAPSARDLSELFRPQMRDADDNHEGGLSIGLALVAKVMLRMGGRVWAERPPAGPGTIVNLALPISDSPA